VIDIVTITDMTEGREKESRPQIYISGTLHGDEVIGPNAAYYLIEYLLSNYLTDPQVTKLLQTRELIITPMTNAAGYYHHEREERLNKEH
jgi:predicted deacylase